MAGFGSRVENELTEATQGKSGPEAQMAQNMVLMRWLGEEAVKGRFRDPRQGR